MLAVDPAGGTIATLVEQAPQPGTTVAVGLDRAVQTAAEDAVEPVPQQAMLVAVAPSTGDLLAVAQNGAGRRRGRARAGRPVPARLHVQDRHGDRGRRRAAGSPSDSPVACPGSTVIGGRPVPNADRFDLGTVPLRTAFARSCNTTFAAARVAGSGRTRCPRPRCGSGWAPTTRCPR